MISFMYPAFGLIVNSEIECCELLPCIGSAHDVSVRNGIVPENLGNDHDFSLVEGVLYQASHDQFLLKLEGIANYLVRNGNEIIVEAGPESDMDIVRLFLFGSAFGALLFQRGVLPLHGSAVTTPKGAVLFVGPSGHGKSTLAGAFHKRGYSVLSDDVCAITSTDGVPMVLPAYPRLLLWADAVGHLAGENANLSPALARQEKYQFPVYQNFASDAVPIRAVYVLHPTSGQTITLTQLTGFDKIGTLTENTYACSFSRE